MICFKPGGNSPGFLRECADGCQSSRPLELPSEATSQVSAMRMASARSMGVHNLTNKLHPFRRGPKILPTHFTLKDWAQKLPSAPSRSDAPVANRRLSFRRVISPAVAVIARSPALRDDEAIQLDRHALVPRARNDNNKCLSGSFMVATTFAERRFPNRQKAMYATFRSCDLCGAGKAPFLWLRPPAAVGNGVAAQISVT